MHLCSGPVAPTRASNTAINARSSSLVVRVTSARPRVLQSPVQCCTFSNSRCVDRLVLLRAAKDGLDAELDATQKTLDKVLQAVQAAQAAQQQPVAGPGSFQDSNVLNSREQQLWDRQAAMMDRMQQQWDQERQVFLAREQQLVAELTLIRQELSQLLLRQAAAGSSLPSTPAAAAQLSVGSSPAAAVVPPAAASSSAASRPGSSAMPGQATISGPSPASAAVAAAIRAVRDEGVTDSNSPTASGDDAHSADGSWQDLFSTSGDRAVSSVASAMAAVDSTDVLADLNLSFNSSSRSRGRRRVTDIGSSSGSSNGTASTSMSSSSSSVDAPPAQSSTVSAASSAGDDAVVQSPIASSSSSSGGGGAEAAVEVQKGDPQGPPPILTAGDDDIFWVSKLHDGLMTAGFYPSDDEVENWLFAEGTQSALLTFQACNGVPETGVTCEETWRQLLGNEAYEEAYGQLSRQGSSSSNGSSNGGSSNGGSSNGSSSAAASVTSAEVAVETTEAANGEVMYSFADNTSSSTISSSSSDSSNGSSGAATSSSSSSGRRTGSGWPVVMDMDGGKEVHALQVCLSKAGYYCGDDDMRWWQFGSRTMDALKTFQACSGLPESGVCDERTWLALLGPDATPDDLDQVRGDESMYEDDMAAPHEGAVWLVGEQRWSKPA